MITTQPHTHLLEQQVQSAPELESLLDKLFSLAAPTWPLANAVAANPLQGLEYLHFTEAAREGQRLFDADCLPGLWQLRQAAELKEKDYREAFELALADAPQYLFLNDQRIEFRPLAEALWQQLEDRGENGSPSALLLQALPHLTALHPWQNTLQAVNRHCITWLAAFMDEGQAAWPMPFREEGFFQAVKTLLVHDRISKGHRSFLRSLPDESLDALEMLIGRLRVSTESREALLRDHLLALPGWAALIRWRSSQQGYRPQQDHPINLTDYLAIRLLIASMLPEGEKESFAPREWVRLNAWAEACLHPGPEVESEAWAHLLQAVQDFYFNLRLELLKLWEAHFRTQLAGQLQVKAPVNPQRPDAQLAFCIDVRSEPFRRQVEAAGDYETFGFAGFFGLPIAYDTMLGDRVNSLPVLLQPAHHLREQAGHCCAHHEERHRRGRQLIKDLKLAYKSLKYNLATPFAAVEALGLPAALITAGRSLIPRTLTQLRARGRQWIHPEIDTVPDITHDGEWGIPLDKQVLYGGNALRMMGLTRNFAPLVVLCGHGSETENNPYAAALDCGACGGSHGGPNAAAMARILNQEAVREALREEGIDIPADTLFVGGEHNTTTDEVRLLDLPQLAEEKQQQVSSMKAGLQQAQKGNLAVRARELGQKDASSMLRRSADWSEVRPEWGLAGNAGFVVAPRHMTANLDLRGRCFLHSYDWQQDPEATSLEVILTAPLVVAQWINSQYFFSTVDNVAFGSGNKVTHNVVGKVGVMQGNGSDLMHGLPWQSVMKDDHNLYHKPLRLTALVVAPLERVEMLVEKHDILQQMIYNEWISLQVYDPLEDRIVELK